MDRNEILRKLPKTDKIMQLDQVRGLTEEFGYQPVLEAVRQAQQQLRGELMSSAEAGISAYEYPEYIREKAEDAARDQWNRCDSSHEFGQGASWRKACPKTGSSYEWLHQSGNGS